VDRFTRRTVAIAVTFAANGLLFASWVSRIPAVRDRLEISKGELGLAIFGLTVGAIVSMTHTGRLTRRYGGRALPVAVALGGSALVVATAAPSVAWLAAGLVVAGMGMGVWDVGMNVAAHELERASARPLMPMFHAAFSLGALAGSGLGALAAHADVSVARHVAAVAVVLVVTVVVAWRAVPVDRGAAAPGPGTPTPAPAAGLAERTRMGVPLLAIALVTFCAAFGEGAAADWSALFLTDERGASETVAAIGYGVFACAMAGARLAGPLILARTGRTRALRACGTLVAAGVGVLVLAPGQGSALVALLLWGLGASLVFPVSMSAAADLPGDPATSIARASAVGYAGFLAGPPAIGILAEQVGLTGALSVVALGGIAIVALAGAAREPRPPADAAVAPPVLVAR
jgi:MFS family permease